MTRFAVAGVLFSAMGLSVAAQLPKLESLRGDYKAAVAAAQAEYNKAVSKAADGYRAKLKDLQASETKAGKLEGALAIRDELKAVEDSQLPLFAEGRDAPNARSRYISGTWKVRYHPSGSTRTYVMGRAGDVTHAEQNRKGLLVADGGAFLLDFGDGNLERASFSGGRLFVEHFSPKANIAKNQLASVGVGELTKK